MLRLFLCNDLKPKLLVALCVRSYVVSEPVLKILDSDSESNVFSDMGLVERYKRDIENVLRGGYLLAGDWMQGNRISDKEAKRCDEEKRAGQSEKHAA
ncbi:uncharacterized protein FTJAE_5021 [Fusarium tjaetaba]|uniref:Uncharacterized protein n=1 Tax=Fusarium tjaetaba TaxID=1567544 RepID=A0A8H5RP20_9HYPO|nr:uncharacterized protein FTJAE_5021 [Fusarium tjaetaba]KAF5638950.1 hypothetical protein FTJAE_5021 [Fusarium tjaetaba]